MTVRVGVNGFGRIGRNFFRAAKQRGAEGVVHVDIGEVRVALRQLGANEDLLSTAEREQREAARIDTALDGVQELREKVIGELRRQMRAAEGVALRVRFLADDDDAVPGAAPLPGERPRVDVRPRPAQQIPVPQDDPHVARLRAYVK